jgi:membrane-associated phospholipid phosphatase
MSRTARSDGSGLARDQRQQVPVLDAAPGSGAAQLASRLRAHAPATVYVALLLLGYLVVAAAVVGLGFLLVDVLVPVHAIGHNDEAVNVWFAHHRSSTLNDASFVGSSIGDIPVLPVLVTLVVIGAAVLRRWRVAAFLLGAILVEVSTYRIASLIVHRERPTVIRLDHLPVNQSFPSGHVAASIAVYVSLAIMVSSRMQRRWVTVTAWSIAILLPAIVATSRMYRGMHHPLDVTSGAIVGVFSITVALLATRAADEVARLRSTGQELS